MFRKILDRFDKKYLSRVVVYAVSCVVAFGVIFYFGYHLVEKLSPGLELVDATLKTVTRELTVDAYIMRDEEPLYASSSGGSVVSAVHNGERVSIHSKVVEIYSSSSADIENRLDEIDEQIALLRKNKSENRSVQSAAGIDSKIYDEVFDIRKHCESGDYSDALSVKTQLIVEIKKRAILTGEITDYDAQIAMLEREKNSLMASLGVCLDSVHTQRSGYFFSEYDGYGEIFSADKVDSMTYDDFVYMTESPDVTVGQNCIGAMVYDYRWYIACEMSKTDAAYFMDVKKCSVTFPYSGETLTMDVYRAISQTPGSRAVIVFRSEKMPDGFDYTRMQPVTISVTEYTGYEIPIEAVRVVGGYEGVFVLEEVTVEFRRINIVYEDGGVVICTGKPQTSGELTGAEIANDEVYPWIELNDIVIVGGRDLYTGKVIE